VLNLGSLDLDEIADALVDQNDYDHWSRDGGIDGETPVEIDELDVVPIDPLPAYEWYRDMADFAAGVSDDRAGRRLGRAIQGRGAFRRFKDDLHEEHPELLPAWYEFRDVGARRRARGVARGPLARGRRGCPPLPGGAP